MKESQATSSYTLRVKRQGAEKGKGERNTGGRGRIFKYKKTGGSAGVKRVPEAAMDMARRKHRDLFP